MHRVISTLLLAIWLLTSAAQADRIDELVKSQLQKQHVPGAWVMVIHNGKVIKRAGYGIANLEDDTPVTPNTPMQTGSIGKMFTATGILVLVNDGKLKLDDSLAKFFPGSPDWWKPITIRHLLSHTGGMPEYEGAKYSIDTKKEYSEDELVKFAQAMQPDFAAGEKYSYSNTDYMLLGVIIHKLTGQFYGDFLRQKVWNPAGMPTMQVIDDRKIVPGRSGGYDWEDGKWLNQDWNSKTANSTADGTLYATPDDFIRWDQALDEYKVLPKPLQELAWTATKLNDGRTTGYGLGWEVGTRFGRRSLSHNGSWQGFVTDYLRLPENHLSITVFANCSSAQPEAIVEHIVEIVAPQASLRNHKALQDSDGEANQVTPFFETILTGVRPQAGALGAKVGMSDQGLNYLKEYARSAGKLERVELVDRTQDTGLTKLSFRLVFQDSVLIFTLSKNTSGDYMAISRYR